MGKGGEVAIMSISPRETACVKGFVGQRERTQGWAGRERNIDKYLESELFVHPVRESQRGGETDGGPGSVISRVAVVVNS